MKDKINVGDAVEFEIPFDEDEGGFESGVVQRIRVENDITDEDGDAIELYDIAAYGMIFKGVPSIFVRKE